MAASRNLVVLFLAQAVFSSGSLVLVTVGGVVGSRIAPAPGLATLPVSLMVAGTALGAVPASLLMARVGRRAGFSAASALATLSALLAASAVGGGHFAAFCAGAVGIGLTMAFGQQLRFAAAESVAPTRAGQAVSFILLGSIGGAVLGGELVARGALLDPAQPYRYPFIGLALAHVLALALLQGLRPLAPMIEAREAPAQARPLLAIVAAPAVMIAVAAAVVGQGTMTFLMTATPVSMHVMDGHAMAATAGVVRAHVIAMYAPSLISGVLIARAGTRGLMALGTLVLLLSVAAGLSGHGIGHYAGALILLGIGWNFLFVGGTTALVGAYRPAERFKAQAFNDFCVFGTAALASLLAGSTVLSIGWERVLYAVIPVLVAMLVLLLVMRLRSPATARGGPGVRDQGGANGSE